MIYNFDFTQILFSDDFGGRLVNQANFLHSALALIQTETMAIDGEAKAQVTNHVQRLIEATELFRSLRLNLKLITS